MELDGQSPKFSLASFLMILLQNKTKQTSVLIFFFPTFHWLPGGDTILISIRDNWIAISLSPSCMDMYYFLDPCVL